MFMHPITDWLHSVPHRALSDPMSVPNDNFGRMFMPRNWQTRSIFPDLTGIGPPGSQMDLVYNRMRDGGAFSLRPPHVCFFILVRQHEEDEKRASHPTHPQPPF